MSYSNTSALSTLDLSENAISGRLPDALGFMSDQLEEVSLELNHLSCGLPESVRHWHTANNSVQEPLLLKGNIFGCGGIALTMQDASGLRRANIEEFDSYSCGGSEFVLPVAVLAFGVFPAIVGIFIAWRRGKLKTGWAMGLAWRMGYSMRINELIEANTELSGLTLGTIGGALAAAFVVLCQVFLVTDSPYECQYASRWTLANYSSDARVTSKLSIGVGVALGVGLMLSLNVFWRRSNQPISEIGRRSEGLSTSPQATRDNGENEKPARDSENFLHSDEQREAEFEISTQSTMSRQIVQLVGLLVALLVLAVGPNVVYVLVVLSDLPYDEKIAGEVGIIVAKTLISTGLIPIVSRTGAHIFMQSSAASSLTRKKFRMRITINTIISALTVVAAPTIIVVVTDERCLRNFWFPQGEVTTAVVVATCTVLEGSTLDTISGCAVYSDSIVKSTYTPSFDYDGGRCVSAVLDVYSPIFLTSVLLTAVLPAVLELFVVPRVAPWCHRRGSSSPAARCILANLRAVTWNVAPVLAEFEEAAASSAGAAPPPSLPVYDADYLAQRVMERGFSQLLGTLLIALTFGVAAPGVGGACAVAAIVQLTHTRHVLGQIVMVGVAGQRSSIPNLKGCTSIPMSCCLIVLAVVLIAWSFASVGFLSPAILGGVAVAAMVAVALVSVVSGRCIRRSQGRRGRRESNAVRRGSWSSAASSKGMLMEPVLDDQDERGE